MNAMKSKRLSKSLKQHIRLQKARIRREALGIKEEREGIYKLYERFFPEHNPTDSRSEEKQKAVKKQALKKKPAAAKVKKPTSKKQERKKK